MEADLHEMNKCARAINRLLEHAVFEEDMVEEEKIFFYGETNEFIELIIPLIRSTKWRVNGNRMQKKFLRSIDEVFKIKNEKTKDLLKFDSLYAALKEYFDRHFPDDAFS